MAGSSMGRTIPRGWRCRVEPTDGPTVGEIWAYIAERGGIGVGRIRRAGTGHEVAVRGDARNTRDVPVARSALVGRVVEVGPAPAGDVPGPVEGAAAVVAIVADNVRRRLTHSTWPTGRPAPRRGRLAPQPTTPSSLWSRLRRTPPASADNVVVLEHRISRARLRPRRHRSG
jgi:hypothetical protein